MAASTLPGLLSLATLQGKADIAQEIFGVNVRPPSRPIACADVLIVFFLTTSRDDVVLSIVFCQKMELRSGSGVSVASSFNVGCCCAIL